MAWQFLAIFILWITLTNLGPVLAVVGSGSGGSGNGSGLSGSGSVGSGSGFCKARYIRINPVCRVIVHE